MIIRETAARRGLNPVMVEKDFWVSWTLAVLFAHPEYSPQFVFKGGTSLSNWFTEGFDTPDLNKAKALLDEPEQHLPNPRNGVSGGLSIIPV